MTTPQDRIAAIRKALEKAAAEHYWDTKHARELVRQALSHLSSLHTEEPVAWMNKKGEVMSIGDMEHMDRVGRVEQVTFTIPLYRSPLGREQRVEEGEGDRASESAPGAIGVPSSEDLGPSLRSALPPPVATLSRDYEALYERLGIGDEALGFVVIDTLGTGHTERTACYIQNRRSCYVFKYQERMMLWKDRKDFIAECTRLSLEWVAPSQKASDTEMHPDHVRYFKALKEIYHIAPLGGDVEKLAIDALRITR